MLQARTAKTRILRRVEVIRYTQVDAATFSLEQMNIAARCAATEIAPLRLARRGIADDMPIEQIIGKLRFSERPNDRVVVCPTIRIDDAQHAADQLTSILDQIEA